MLPLLLLLHSLLIDEALLDARLHPLLVLAAVLFVQLGGHRVGGRVGVGVAEQRLYRGQDGGHVVRGTPPVLQDVQADAAVRVHVRVEHLGDEADRRRLVRVLLGKFYCQLKRAVLEGGVVRPENHSVPYHDVVVCGRPRHTGRRVLLQSAMDDRRVGIRLVNGSTERSQLH